MSPRPAGGMEYFVCATDYFAGCRACFARPGRAMVMRDYFAG